MSDSHLDKKRSRVIPEAMRRQQILDAASCVFSEKGYWAATMDELSRQAGMSKKTVYQLFSSKAEIFDLLLRSFTQPFSVPFETCGRSQRDILTDGLFRLARSMLEEAQVEVVRVIIANAAQPGDVADAVERQGLCRGDWALQSWLASQHSLGTHPIDNPESMAATIFWAAVGDLLMGMLLRIRPRPSDAELSERVSYVVGLYF